MPNSGGLEELEKHVQRALELTRYPSREWVKPRTTRDGEPILDVLIVGGGQSGLAAAALLMRERVDNIRVVDRNPEGRAGPWLDFARMITLRTPKHVTGPDLSIAHLTIQAWYEAVHGVGSWEQLGLIPKETWAAYLAWYQRVLALPVRSRTRAGALRWNGAERCFEVPLCEGAPGAVEDGATKAYARRVVLATGIEGSGDWHVPPFIADALPRHLYAHTRADIDFANLAGKRIGVLGAGASAFDNAAVALERGARTVTVCFRRSQLVRVNAYRWAEFVGFLKHMGDLPDADKWRFISQILRMGQLPPADTLARARAHAGLSIAPGTPWQAVRAEGEEILVDTPRGTLRFDFVIVATGFRTDLSLRPELAELHESIARWSDRYTPPAEEAHDDLSRHPYLGPSFEFTEKIAGQAPCLAYVYNYTFGGVLSLGFGGGSISGMKYSLPRLVSGITRSLFLEDKDATFASLCAYDLEEFTP